MSDSERVISNAEMLEAIAEFKERMTERDAERDMQMLALRQEVMRLQLALQDVRAGRQ